MSTDHVPAYVTALARHFADLRDDTHGNAHSRADKETLFATAVGLLDRYAREALAEVNTHLLLDTGTSRPPVHAQPATAARRPSGRCPGQSNATPA
jgi:hypothetical protein